MATIAAVDREGHRQRRARHRRQARRGAPGARRAALPGPPADRGRARHRQDVARQGHRASSLGCTFRRIQFTPDLLPSDVTGLSIYNQKTQEFEFRPGPIMAQIVLADEINRATPKTQSALLECMEERQATVDGVTYQMPEPFLVIATQNPIEYEGTFALPEAQLDRFMLRLQLGYPQPLEEVRHPRRAEALAPDRRARRGRHAARSCARCRTACARSTSTRQVSDYIVRLVNATRNHPDVYLGASPRGSLALYRAGQAYAALSGRDYVIPDDIKALAVPALAHRQIVKTAATVRDVDSSLIIRELLDSVPVEIARRQRSERPAAARPRLGQTTAMVRRIQLLVVAGRAARCRAVDGRPVPVLPRLPGHHRRRRLVRRDALRAGRPRGRLRPRPSPRPGRRHAPRQLHGAQHQPPAQAVARGAQPDQRCPSRCPARRSRSGRAASDRGRSACR